MSEPAGVVLPIYFVADESGSMEDVIDDLNLGLTALLDKMHEEPFTAAKIRFAVVGFSNVAHCYLELCDLREVEQMPTFRIGGGTTYSKAFDDLATRIPADHAKLRADGYQVHRPAVFFLTDGYPTDKGWEASLDALCDPSVKTHPNIIAFGIGKAEPETILRVATDPDFAFKAAEGVDTATALVNFATALTQSMVESSRALAEGKSELQIKKPEGFLSLKVPLVD